MRRSFAAQMAKSERTESILMTGANVSSKSNSASCANPLTTIRVLYFSKTFVASHFVRQTHLRGSARRPSGKRTSDQVFRAIIALISSQKAFHQSLASGRRIASMNEGGSLLG